MSALTVSSVPVVPCAASGSSAIDQARAGLLPVTEGLWQEVYRVIAPIADDGVMQLWRAFHLETLAEVVLLVLPGGKGDARAEAWTRLAAIDHPHLQKALGVHHVGNFRVEVYEAPRGVMLEAWRKGRPAVDVSTVETIVRQLTQALGKLHANGLVHLGMQPKVIFIHEGKNGLQCTLGGLGTVAGFEHKMLVPMRVDPSYAPPEAAALELHEPGPALCKWDWWTLGRVTQELILGHHVLDDLPEAVAAQFEPERRARAETLLLEQDPQGPCAGAVEAMHVDSRLTVLLRGLLASSPEGRWDGGAVDHWLQREPVKENYGEKRIEHKFRWRGRLCTVPEAARELQTAEHWDEAAAQVFNATTPGTLAHFIRNMPEQQPTHRQLGELLKNAGADSLCSLLPEVSREITLMLALLQLAGENLFWRGRRINGETLRALLAEEPDKPERHAFVRVLTDRTVTSQIMKYDREAGGSLVEAGVVVADAEALVRRLGWLKGRDETEEDAIFRLAFETDAVLQAAHARLKLVYACAGDPAVGKIFQSEKSSRSELVALAWAEPKAGSLGFITHQEVKAVRLAALSERCRHLARLIFWRQLERALRAGPLVFGRLWMVVAGWLAITLVLAVERPGLSGLGLGLLPLGLMALLRFSLKRTQARLILPWSEEPRTWGWNDHFARCRDEISRLARQHDLPAGRAETAALFRRLNAERTALAKPESCQPIAWPPRHSGTWSVSIASWVLAVAVVFAGVELRGKTAPTWAAHRKAWQSLFLNPPQKPVEVKSKEPPVTRISWPYRAPHGNAFDIVSEGVFIPDAEQTKYATARARDLVKGYKPETIDSPVVIYVPLEGSNGALLFYDGKKGAFIGRTGVRINYVPLPRMWMQIGDQRYIFIEK